MNAKLLLTSLAISLLITGFVFMLITGLAFTVKQFLTL